MKHTALIAGREGCKGRPYQWPSWLKIVPTDHCLGTTGEDKTSWQELVSLNSGRSFYCPLKALLLAAIAMRPPQEIGCVRSCHRCCQTHRGLPIFTVQQQNGWYPLFWLDIDSWTNGLLPVMMSRQTHYGEPWLTIKNSLELEGEPVFLQTSSWL